MSRTYHHTPRRDRGIGGERVNGTLYSVARRHHKQQPSRRIHIAQSIREA